MSKKKLGRVAVTDEREMFSRPGVARSKNKRLLEQAWYEAYKLRGSDDDEGALRAFQRCVELSGDDDSAVVSAAQNNMGELWSVLNAVDPAKFSLEEFTERYSRLGGGG